MAAAGVVSGCSDAELSASDVVEAVGDDLALREVDPDDFLLWQLLESGALAREVEAEHVEARVLVDDVDESSFLLVVEGAGAYRDDDLDAFVELTEELAASRPMEAVDGLDDTFASPCCIVRLVDGLVIAAADRAGELADAVRALE